jgi:hypothetical protein
MKNGTVTFPPGAVTKSVSVSSIGDTIIEPDQHVLVVLHAPIGGTATIADGTGAVTLVDDDAGGVNPGIEASIGDVTVTEADGGTHKASFPVTLSRPATVTTKVAFTMDCQTAATIDDVSIKLKGTITFQVGQRSSAIVFKIGANLVPETVESIVQSIKSKLASVQVLDQRGDATINDDDGSLASNPGYRVPGFATESIPSGTGFNAQSVGDIEQVSLTPTGGQPTIPIPNQDGGSWQATKEAPSVSHDGRFVAFSSDANDLVPGDTNGIADVFVRDRATGTTERVSLTQAGGQVPFSAYPDFDRGPGGAVISEDGRYVAYVTAAALAPGDGPGDNWTLWYDTYVFDRVTRTTRPVSVTNSGQYLHAGNPDISANGRYVMFHSTYNQNLYVRDLQNQTTTLVYEHDKGTAALSANGRFAVVASGGVGCFDDEVVVIDFTDGSTERVDVTDDGVGAAQEDESGYLIATPTISDDGRFVAFKSDAWNLMPGISQPAPYPGAFNVYLIHTYVRDRALAETTLVGLGPNGQIPAPTSYAERVAMSGDGTKVAVSEFGHGQGKLFDLAAGTQGSIGPAYSQSNSATQLLPTSISGDGRYVGFDSRSIVVSPATQAELGKVLVQRLP